MFLLPEVVKIYAFRLAYRKCNETPPLHYYNSRRDAVFLQNDEAWPLTLLCHIAIL